jgi:alpha-aminoadipic semialdehyde synthase
MPRNRKSENMGRAKSAEVLLLNEIGLDPGIDHCSATDLRERIEAEGRRVISFVSWCGGLPAPEDSNVCGFLFFLCKG